MFPASEGGIISSIVQDEYRYSPVFQSDYATSQPQGHRDRSGCDSRSKQRREACVGEANRALKSENDILTSLTPTEPRLTDTQLIFTTCVLVKIEVGAKIGAKIGTVHSQRSQIT